MRLSPFRPLLLAALLSLLAGAAVSAGCGPERHTLRDPR
jgi:hypothetical protein